MRVELKEAQQVTITILVDNYTDAFMSGAEEVKRPTLSKKGKRAEPLLAEHGFAALIEIMLDGAAHKILMDAGTTEESIFHNLKSLELDLQGIEAIVLSHGHPDHNAALARVIESLPVKGIPLITHPDAFLKRRIRIPGREEVILPEFKEKSLKEAGAEVIKNREPYLLAEGSLLVTGEVPRVTDFEKGFPPNYAEIDGEVRPDPVVHDDQALIMKVKDKGLIVLSGCAHAGIINSTLYARELTGEDKVHAVLGGFHLSGPLFEPLIDRTIAEIKKIDPKMIVPTHCTGSNAMFRFRQELPETFVHNCVGTRFVF
jgi:7,8-dihydropterin-6-yl-methyl-4-(beta-D-ribofuranosyl)aminobenzene 5'-phosphate synthase